MVPGIRFEVARPRLAPDPNRMDLALFVGFLAEAAGDAALAARARVAAGLAAEGWATRIAGGNLDDLPVRIAAGVLTDLPVRVASLGEVEALYDLAGRADRVARVIGEGLAESVVVAPEDGRFALVLDGAEQEVDLATGAQPRAALLAALQEGLAGVEVALGEADALGRRALVFTRTAAGAGGLTVYRNASLALPLAQRDQTRLTGCPMGAALRAFFGSGGREAVIVPMGAPVPLFASEAERVAALGRLVGGGYGDGVTTIAALAALLPPGLPGAFPPRDPWHGLAHLHGLPETALVLMPDLPDLIAIRPPVEPVAASAERPPEVFTACAAPGPMVAEGLSRAGAPALADADGLRLFTRLAGWAAEQTVAISREAMVIAAPPLPAGDVGAGPAGVLAAVGSDPLLGDERSRAQLQLVAPWAVSRHARDLPGGAMPADGLLAGAIAGRALAAGAWQTVAGRALPSVSGLLGAAPGLDPEAVRQVTLLGGRHGGIEVMAERTADPGLYRQAHVRRLMALVLRAARHRGNAAVFEANGPRTWRDVVMALTGILRNLHGAGALAGVREEDAFEVRCDGSTMSQQDIDLGRMIAEVRLRPAASLEIIDVVLVLRGGDGLRGAA